MKAETGNILTGVRGQPKGYGSAVLGFCSLLQEADVRYRIMNDCTAE